MGNKGSFEQHLDFRDISKNYIFEKKINDGRFGEVKILKDRTLGQKVFEKDFSSNTPQQLSEYIEEIKDFAGLDHPHILKIYGYNSKKEDLFCSDFYKVSLFFENFDSDLDQEIQKRQFGREYYPEAELWFILDSIASACAYFQNNKVIHRDIRPFNILITSTKEYKIAPTSLFKATYNPLYFNAFNSLEGESRYYSPELLKYYSTPVKHRVSFDEYQSDVFSLGMTLLELCLLERPKGLYDFDKMFIREHIITHSLNSLRSRYSENFVKTLEAILDFNPRNRLDFIRLDMELGFYRKDIRENARGIITPRFTHPDVIESKEADSKELDSKVVESKEIESKRTELSKSTLPDEAIFETHKKITSLEDLEKRIQQAVQRTEQLISSNSPKKTSNGYFDDYNQFLQSSMKYQFTTQSTVKEFEAQSNRIADYNEFPRARFDDDSSPKRYAQPESFRASNEEFVPNNYNNNSSLKFKQDALSEPLGLLEDQGVSLRRNTNRADNLIRLTEESPRKDTAIHQADNTPSWQGETFGSQKMSSFHTFQNEFNHNSSYLNNQPPKSYSQDLDINADELTRKVAERLNISKKLY